MRLLLLSLVLVSAGRAAGGDPTRAQLYQALLTAHVLDPDRQLVHLSQTCSLIVDGKRLPVLDVQESVPGAVVPRGVNRIAILSPALRPVQLIEYTNQRPLFCLENHLYLYDDITIHGMLPEGNVLTFTGGGNRIKLSHQEANDEPIPLTRDRKGPPQ